jgi:YHS domain-containing protein
MGGCCDQGYKPKDAEVIAKDPVCGMKVDCEDKNALKLKHEECEVFFCSTACMTKFINAPEAYKTKKRSIFDCFKKK